MRWYEGPLVGFDLETTGTDPTLARPVSFAFVLHDPHNEAPFRVNRGLVNPDMPIPREATAVHRITDSMVYDAMPVDEAVRLVISKLQRLTTEGYPIVGTNLAYDLTVLDRQALRLGFYGLQQFAGPVLDIYVLDKKVDRFRKGKRTLSALADQYHILLPEGESAHSAAADATLSCLVVREMALAYKELRFQSPEQLHEKQVEWRREQQSSLSEHFEKNGKEPIPEWQWEWPVYPPDSS